ncbi:MAG: 2,3-epoxybenzoyl-CoA dihydrolase [Sandaracinaceae bacterium]|nr:2,3-epoxybenzoyl-CoA dihydrolase [Sandaracinaceae bacterium]
MFENAQREPPLSLDVHPSRYRHWKLEVDRENAALYMRVDPHGGFRPGYELKLNSYDLGVDIELADAIDRLRFEHPEVQVVLLRSVYDRVFCAGANIYMLAGSSHGFKVNFCKFTNETRLAIEDASCVSGQKYIAAISGPCAGGGYELALACDAILLVDDGHSAVSLPEVSLLGVLPGTGGLTRLVDKRKVRRDIADLFCTMSEGVRGKRALEWGLVDAIAPKSRFEALVSEYVARLAQEAQAIRPSHKRGPGIGLEPIAPQFDGSLVRYRHLLLEIDASRRVAYLTIFAPDSAPPPSAEAMQNEGASQWSIRAFRELDDALVRLRFDYPEIGLVVLQTQGDGHRVLEADLALLGNKDHWLAQEIIALQARVLRRLDVTSKSFFALIDKGSAFVGSLFELALASDRIYILDNEAVSIQLSPLNFGLLPMHHGLSRLEARFYGDPGKLDELRRVGGPISAKEAVGLGLATVGLDEIDWEDDVRIAIEERTSLSPDALTGMEASLRFPGPETMQSKIFARLSAWQNWIFQRPNAVGPEGALTRYGQPERPVFSWTRC